MRHERAATCHSAWWLRAKVVAQGPRDGKLLPRRARIESERRFPLDILLCAEGGCAGLGHGRRKVGSRDAAVAEVW